MTENRTDWCKVKTNTQYPNNKILTLDTGLISPQSLYRTSHDKYSIKLELQTIVGRGKTKQASLQNGKFQFSHNDRGALPEGTFRISEDSNEDCIVIYLDEKA